jgi:hypothetical protein
MFGSTAIEVAIGLIFVYMALSLVCSSLKEMIAQFTKLRGKTLKEGINRMLSDDTLYASFYEHPLIKSMSQKSRQKMQPPSYIPSKTFAITLLDVVSNLEKRQDRASDATDPIQDPTQDPTQDATQQDATQDPTQDAAAESAIPDFSGLREKIDNLPPGDIRTVLLTLFDNADNDLERAKQNVEAWFDSTMDRVSGWYKRKTQLILLVLAFIVTGAMNADTIKLTSTFLQNPALRGEIALAASRYMDEQESNAQKKGTDDKSTPVVEFKQQLKLFEKLSLPLGWSKETLPNGAEWILKIIGLAFTAFAASLGAPFWYDLLNKLTKLRATGKIPPKATEN